MYLFPKTPMRLGLLLALISAHHTRTLSAHHTLPKGGVKASSPNKTKAKTKTQMAPSKESPSASQRFEAEEPEDRESLVDWLTDQGPGVVTALDSRFPRWFAEAISIAEEHWNMPDVVNRYGKLITEAEYLAAILFIESRGIHGNPKSPIRSHAGAMGFMQLMPAAAKDVKARRHDPRSNLLGGASYLTYCFQSPGARESGSDVERLVKAAAGYNRGPNARSLRRSWNRYIEIGAHESVAYGIQLKMALGFDLTPKEVRWFARHRSKPTSWVPERARQIYAQTRQLIRVPEVTVAD